MELREWLIILGLALVTIIVIDGVRRLQRQRRVPRLDQVDASPVGTGNGKSGVKAEADPEEVAREAEINWELPNGGARVVKPASYSRDTSQEHDMVIPTPKPKLKRQEHPGPSRVLSSWRREAAQQAAVASASQPEPERVVPTQKPSDTISSSAPLSEKDIANKGVASKPSRVEPAMEQMSSKEQVSSPRDASPKPASSQTPEEPLVQAEVPPVSESQTPRAEPTLSALDDGMDPEADDTTQPLAADPADHEEYQDGERYRLVDLDGMSDSLRSRSARAGASMQRFGASVKKSMAERKEQRKKEKLERARIKTEREAREASRRQQAEAEKALQRQQEEARLTALREQQVIDAQEYDDPLFAPGRLSHVDSRYDGRYADGPAGGADHGSEAEPAHYSVHHADAQVGVEGHAGEQAAPRPIVENSLVERVLRHDVNGDHARDTLSHADEVIVISVMSRDEEGFSGPALLELMLACGLRYSSDMGIFHRCETEDPGSELQFSMVNVIKPGTFPLESMETFQTPGITLLMPLPGAADTSAAFEAMVETAMVVVRHLGGELKDENRSVMTAQTVEFARQRVHDFERRHRLHRYQVN
ncbi:MULTISPECIES: cell division protein ZipA [Halomonadaceae]|uniref:cell division protein ZipA n=1 Tax=Halomonadaceae TaxID=28256 RepID=UPI001598176F|nr:MULTISPECIES: cell division protein ZipA [Halomonas]QJQ95164.1 cell division protein ZipA [Halomonas sp. PA5]